MNFKGSFLGGAILLILTFGVLRSASGDSSHTDALKLIKDYRSWKKANETPAQMSPLVSTLCRPPTQTEKRLAEKDIHKDKFVTVYVNEPGFSEFAGKQIPHFPEGTTIVKEKLSSQTASKPELLTVMVKRKRGFDRANGDWEYLTFDGTATKVTSSGKMQNCQECHADQRSEDYVFRSFLPAEVWKNMK